MEEIYSAVVAWDRDSQVWYIADTNFPGLVAEAASQQDLLRKIRALVPELYELNRHLIDPPPSGELPLRVSTNVIESIRVTG